MNYIVVKPFLRTVIHMYIQRAQKLLLQKLLLIFRRQFSRIRQNQKKNLLEYYAQ